MSEEIFISYAREDRPKAQRLGDALRRKGWSVFWDQDLIVGGEFHKVLEEKLEAAKCVIVLWSERSAKSRFVRAEAGEAADRGCLVPALIEDVRIPLGFREIQTARLMDWDGEPDHEGLLRVVHAVASILGEPLPADVEETAPKEEPLPGEPAAAPKPKPRPRPRAKPKAKPRPEPEKRSLEETIRETGLKFREVSGGLLAVPFGGDRIDQVIIQVRELSGGITYFAAPLPELGRRRKEAGVTGLLRTSFTVNYVKALSVESGMGMVVELPSALVSPKVAEGIIRGLVHLADVTEKDLADKSGWEERMVKSALAQARFITVDVGKAKQDIPEMLEAAGLDCDSPKEDAFITTIEIAGKGLKVLARVSDKVISFILYLPGVKPTGDKNKYLAHLLDINRVANVAKVGLDSDGDVAFLYELPEMLPDTVEHMKEQFTRLLALAVALHAGES